MVSLWWVRDDPRLSDNPALTAAAQAGPVVAITAESASDAEARPLGAAAQWWRGASLAQLRSRLAKSGVPLLTVESADAAATITRAAQELGADTVFWQRRYHQPFIEQDKRVYEALRDAGLRVSAHDGYLLHDPRSLVKSSDGQPYKVYSAYARACAERPEPDQPLEAPADLRGPDNVTVKVAGKTLHQWLEGAAADSKEPATGWRAKLAQHWQPGELAGMDVLADFAERSAAYATDRDFPARNGTSNLSPFLRCGDVSPRQAWHAVDGNDAGASAFRSEMLWREFAWHRLFFLPDLHTTNVRRRFDAYPWHTDADALEAWKTGQTGCPLVDAGMRELWQTGHMHGRVRMVVASYLIKNLGIDWRRGEEWFWNTLVDADYASNPFNWQWCAGTGDDAAPYFRIFNPERQRERFDPTGQYAQKWVPELGTDAYPPPLVDLAESRREALAAYKALPT